MNLAKLIKDLVDADLVNMNVGIPAIVTRADMKKGCVDVQIVIKREYADGEVVAIPVIPNVPLATYRAGDAFVSLPVKKNHYVFLMFSQRSLDAWLQKGGVIEAKDPRKFHLNDAVAYPGVYPYSQPAVGADAEDIIVKNAQGEFRVKPAGKFKITNGENELVDLVKQLSTQLGLALDALNMATTNTMLGPMKLINSATYGTLKGEVESITGKIDSLKG